MTVYNVGQLQKLLGIGKAAAYAILHEYGFRTGYSDKSPLRITEEGVMEWADRNKTMNIASRKTPSNG